MKSEFRVVQCNDAAVNIHGQYVLYWMIANRRTSWNFSLERAVEWAVQLKKPLVIFEPLRCDYRWASDRLHSFIIDGMKDTAQQLQGSPVLYYPYLEHERGAGKGLLCTLADQACLVVTDDFPSFFLPRMVDSAAAQLPILMEKVDSNGILPIRWTEKVFSTAFSFRRFLQKNLEPHLHSFPKPDPLRGAELAPAQPLPEAITTRWPSALTVTGTWDKLSLESFPIDHDVSPSPIRGGHRAATSALRRFLHELMPRYAESRNHPDHEVTSGLSPYLHFGHISVHQVFREVMDLEGWSEKRFFPSAGGKRQGWWGVGENAEAFLDELITWREIGYNMCCHREDYDRYESLPDWARQTLEKHRNDLRSPTYTLDEFEQARTHDPLWNAAQTQLVREGRLHNYLRMLWGKKILEWSPSPNEALRLMVELNNKYALDGRNPNSYTGIFWVLGRYDRAWGPERRIFGKVRYMSSESALRKLRVKEYLKKYSTVPHA